MKILAVDDEKAALNVLTEAIGEAAPAAMLYAFQSPVEALAFAKETACDVAFIDIKMFEMNGIELAKQLKKCTQRLNIIFVTGYSEYAGEAMNLRASGYLLKPVEAADVREELDNLRFPVHTPAKGVYAQTFGNFELFSEGKPVVFPRAKSKELLAYLVDRHGSGVTRKEIAGILFEDREYNRKTQDYVNHVIADMVNALKQAGVANILVRERNFLAVDISTFECDLYAFEKGEPYALNTFKGEYMVQYSWAEVTGGRLYR